VSDLNMIWRWYENIIVIRPLL